MDYALRIYRMTVEDGSGKRDADSYCSLEEAATYHLLRGNASWMNATDDEKEVALVRACDYLEYSYKRLWYGTPCTLTQRLAFPRNSIKHTAQGEIPVWLKEAQYEAALLELEAPGILSEDPSEGGMLEKEQEGEVARNFAQGPASTRRFPQLYRRLAPYLRNPARLEVTRG